MLNGLRNHPCLFRAVTFSIAKICSKIFIFGGEIYKKALDSVEIFDGEAWRDGPKMPNTRIFAPAVVIPIEFARHLNQP